MWPISVRSRCTAPADRAPPRSPSASVFHAVHGGFDRRHVRIRVRPVSRDRNSIECFAKRRELPRGGGRSERTCESPRCRSAIAVGVPNDGACRIPEPAIRRSPREIAPPRATYRHSRRPSSSARVRSPSRRHTMCTTLVSVRAARSRASAESAALACVLKLTGGARPRASRRGASA